MLRVLAACCAAALAASPALAGPPFATDDPVPTDCGKWEIYAFADTMRADGDFDGDAGFDINYGAAPDVQLTVTLPVADRSAGVTRARLGDVEVGVKWRIAHQRDDGRGIDVAVFPKLALPTARNGRARTALILPVWAQRTAGKWSLFGGGGYTLVNRRDGRSHGFAGIAANRTITERLALGAELYREGAEEVGGRALLIGGVAASYALSHRLALISAFDPVLADRARNGSYRAYLALAFRN